MIFMPVCNGEEMQLKYRNKVSLVAASQSFP